MEETVGRSTGVASVDNSQAKESMTMQSRFSRRSIVCTTLLTAVASTQQTTAQNVEATPPSSSWDALPSEVSIEPVTQGTADELLLISELITVARITATPGEPGVMSFFNDSPGMIGPRIIYVEQGALTLGPLDVSPGSLAGPALFVRQEEPSPAVILPGSPVEATPGEMVFFPADTSFEASNFEGTETAILLEIDVFPRFPVNSGVVVTGMTAQPLAVDIGIATADPAAPPVIGVSRLSLPPQTSVPSDPVPLPRIFYIEQGSVTVTVHEGELQLKRSDVDDPGEIVDPGAELVLGVGDAFMIPPGGSSSVKSSEMASALLALDIGLPI